MKEGRDQTLVGGQWKITKKEREKEREAAGFRVVNGTHVLFRTAV